MKKLFMGLLLLGSICAFTPSAFSQSTESHHQKGQGGGHGGGAGQGGRELDYTKLKTELTLTDDQVTSWKALETQYKTKFDEAQKLTTEEEKRAKTKELRTAKEADLKKILSDEQYTKFTSNRPQKGGK